VSRESEYKALAGLRYEIRRFLSFSEQAARVAQIEPQQHQALLAIKGLPDGLRPTVGVLAERLQIHHHSAVELSNRLESKELIRREAGKRDRREVLLCLTPAGEKLLRTLSASHHEELQTAGPRLLKALKRVVRRKTPRRSSK
jgi:DNA-binding MarR family transcriptional regulator